MLVKLRIKLTLLVISTVVITIFLSGYSMEQFDLSAYPYSIPKKSETELKNIEQRFKNKNGQDWEVQFDPYTGLFFSGGTRKFKEAISPLNKEESQRVISNFLKENKEFWGLEEFEVAIDPIHEGNYETLAYVIEPHQTYKNLFVARVVTEYAYVSPDDYKNRVSLSFEEPSNDYTQKPHLDFYINYFYYYPGIKSPTEPKISQEDAIERLYGYEYGTAGVEELRPKGLRPGKAIKRKFEKTNNTFKASRLVILPWPNKEKTKLEFRLAWQIEIDDVMYTAYVDAITGEVITLRGNFQE